jgi:hypothetical protein
MAKVDPPEIPSGEAPDEYDTPMERDHKKIVKVFLMVALGFMVIGGILLGVLLSEDINNNSKDAALRDGNSTDPSDDDAVPVPNVTNPEFQFARSVGPLGAQIPLYTPGDNSVYQ